MKKYSPSERLGSRDRFDSFLRNIVKYVFTFVFIAAFSIFIHRASAAANITLVSPTIAADGVTMTATISGGSGSGYAPASGVTGLTVKMTTHSGATFPIASTSISGTTLTINLAAFVPASETMTLTIATSSNLTDSGANTATGQTSIAVTNNSAKTVSRATDMNPAIQYFGRTANINGGIFRYFAGWGSEALFVVNATDATAHVYATNAGAFSVSVDGGAPVTPTLAAFSGAAYTILPLFSGLPPGDHIVLIKEAVNYSGYGIASNFIQAAGGTGVYRAVTESDGLGYNPLTYLRMGDAQFATAGDTGNLALYASTGYTLPSSYSNNPWPNARIRVQAKASTIKLWVYRNGAVLNYDIDGVPTGSITLPNSLTYGFVTLATGLDNTAYHTYGITVSVQGSPLGLFADGFMLLGSGAAYGSSLSALPGVGGFGDSITQGVVLPDARQDWLYRTGIANNQTVFNRGISGSTVISGGQNRTADITGILPKLYKNFVLYGTNDMATIGTTPNAAFGTAFQSMLTSLLAGTTNTVHYVMGLLPRYGFSAASIANWNGSGNGIQGSIAAVQAARPGDAARLVYIDPSSWKLAGVSGTDFTTNYTSGGVHPNNTGNIIMANRIIPLASATGFAVSGPASGSSGLASTNFTVTIASGATFTGNETVTLSDGASGGTFTPSVGSPGTSSVIVTPADTTTSFTFTYTPASPGTKTLVFTNAQSWTNPGNLSYFSSGDFQAPSVSMTAPTDSSTVSGALVSLSANASDDVGVVGVQFKLDGSTNIGAEDTGSSYGVTWDSTGVVDGVHTLTAVARDAAGNSTTSSTVTVTVDNTTPVRSAGAPSGTLTVGTTSTSISLTTNETSTCKYSTSSGTAYGSMTVFSTTNGTSHSTSVIGLSNGGSYVYYVKCQDAQANTNATDYTISFSVAEDTTSIATISVTTNADATCKYSANPETPYESMTLFSTTGGTSHSTPSDGTGYAYYVKCQSTQ